jgi:hypothetical protein
MRSLHSSDLYHVHSQSTVNEYSVLVHEFQWFEPCFCEGTSPVVGIQYMSTDCR